jgi:disulfide bond formation protein DsbB
MQYPSSRMLNLLGLLAVASLLAITAYMQYFMHLNPCPLCLLQRAVMCLLGAVFVIGSVVKFKRCGQMITALSAIIIAAGGLLLAARQVWLQYFPHDTSSDCGASLDYMLQAYPYTQVLKKIFAGTSDCSHMDWQFLHVSLAGWACVSFVGLMVLAGWQLRCSFLNAK